MWDIIIFVVVVAALTLLGRLLCSRPARQSDETFEEWGERQW